MTTWHSAGPPALGLELGADPQVGDGWLVRDARAPEGLDGPHGVLQGGFAASFGLLGARAVDRFGAPLTRIVARLHAPTPLGRDLHLDVRDAEEGAATYETRLRDGETLLVTSTVELAGHEPTPRIGDLLALASVPLPDRDAQPEFPGCWVCGADPQHPLAQRCWPGWHGDAIVNPWIPDDELADADGRVDEVVVAAMLDCPGVWSAMPQLRAAGYAGCLLAGFELRLFQAVPALEPLRLVARTDAVDGRKVRVRSAVVDEDGITYAAASALHIAVHDVPTLP
ncbi:hypothetical protein FTX61_01170 [Nitriliruptoraceae bacterium ZYF776]|nr:hypothetical protein [Profundirhabdus halotolerans]